MQDFYYQVGEFSTTTRWYRPTWMKIRRFLLELKKTEIYKKYKIVLYGGVLYDINDTWDLDIQLISKNLDSSYDELERDLYLIYDIALNNHKLLIDITCLYEILNSDITRTDFYAKNYVDLDFYLIKIGYFKKIEDGVVIEGDFLEHSSVERLTKYLVKRKSSYPSGLLIKGHERWFKHENSKKFYEMDEFLEDTDVDFFNKTNK